MVGGCCDWCRSLAGTYSYPNVPPDVYKRHRNCRCTVDYYPTGKGKRQDVWSKEWIDDFEPSNANYRNNISAGNYSEDVTKEYIDGAKPGDGVLILENNIRKET